MRLVARASREQLEASRRAIDSTMSHHESHWIGLDALLAEEEVDPATIVGMIRGSDGLGRRYGAIAARRLVEASPGLMAEVGSSDEPDLQKFHQRMGT